VCTNSAGVLRWGLVAPSRRPQSAVAFRAKPCRRPKGESEQLARSDKQLESEKLELKNYFEKQIAAERKLADEKAKYLKLEFQLKEQRILAEQFEITSSSFGMSKSTAYASAMTPPFAKPMSPSTRSATKRTASMVGNTSTGFSIPGLSRPGTQPHVLVATPRVSCALASVTSALETVQTHFVQPNVVYTRFGKICNGHCTTCFH